MCREYAKLMMHATRKVYAGPINNTFSQIDGFDASRVAVMCQGSPTVTCYLAFSIEAPTSWDANLSLNMPPTMLDIRSFGKIVQWPLWVKTNAGSLSPVPITVYQVPVDILERYLNGRDIEYP